MDEGKRRAIQVEKEGFPDAVVWNPWIKKAAGMADFADAEYKVKSLPTFLNVIHFRPMRSNAEAQRRCAEARSTRYATQMLA